MSYRRSWGHLLLLLVTSVLLPSLSHAQLPAFYNFDSGPQGWTSHDLSGRGDFAGLFSGDGVVQGSQIPNLTKLWGFFQNSTEFYACGGYPTQQAVPHVNMSGQYLHNEIWSPAITITPGSCTAMNLAFDVYEDLPLDNLVYYTWGIRVFDSGVWSPWYSGGEYLGDDRRWHRQTFNIDESVIPGGISPTATQVQVSLGAIDHCDTQCGVLGTGACHSDAPLFDNVELTAPSGPGFTVKLADLFQDSFSDDGTLAGVVRIDPPGKSAVSIRVSSICGLAPDATDVTKDAVYLFVKDLTGKSGVTIQHSGPLYPVVTTPALTGWTTIRMNHVSDDIYEGDVNDALYTPGDMVEFFFGAEDSGFNWRYWSQFTGTTPTMATAAAQPCEMTCLPTPGRTRLYVNGVDGDDDHLFYDSYFSSIGWTGLVDRYDIRDPLNPDSGLRGRVANVAVQLGGYDTMMWGSGDALGSTIGDGLNGSGDDYAAIEEFLDTHIGPVGLLIEGNNVFEQLSKSIINGSPSAVLFRTVYLPQPGTGLPCHLGIAVNPTIIGYMPNTIFQGPPFPIGTPWSFPAMSDGYCFDVISGVSVDTECEMTFENLGTAYCAVVRNKGVTTANNDPITTFMSTVAYKRIGTVLGVPVGPARTSMSGGVPTRDYFLSKILQDMGVLVSDPVAVKPGPGGVGTLLEQNYPNPFNPDTAIRFFIKSAGTVSLVVYDSRGQRVRTLVNGFQSPRSDGIEVKWDGRDDQGTSVSSGIYFCKLVAGSDTQVRKMMLLK
ncbi:MAG TPA: FlgD immunoglobulin-like domain containing protein [Candidatus Krumholzibacteria bacterium]|nr:FlgD immunoglobulin-like domain containing protein [Candidatus Krumholzibacteria bacterium]